MSLFFWFRSEDESYRNENVENHVLKKSIPPALERFRNMMKYAITPFGVPCQFTCTELHSTLIVIKICILKYVVQRRKKNLGPVWCSSYEKITLGEAWICLLSLNVELLHPLHFTLHAVARPYEGGKLKCRERKYTLSGSTGRRNEKKRFYSSKEWCLANIIKIDVQPLIIIRWPLDPGSEPAIIGATKTYV
jgi:hypothetical protein